MHDQTHTIPFHHVDHGKHDVVISVSRLEGNNYLLSCELPISGEVITAKASDCFEALRSIRNQIEGLGWSIRKRSAGGKNRGAKIGTPTKSLALLVEFVTLNWCT
jgi:hypothetical protein